MINKVGANLHIETAREQSQSSVSRPEGQKTFGPDELKISYEAKILMMMGEDISDSRCEIEHERRMIEALFSAARENAEMFEEWMRMEKEQAERMRKVMKIAARIASGGNVPLRDREFLREHSPGMYMLANSLRIERKNPREYESVLSDENTHPNTIYSTVLASNSTHHANPNGEI